AAGGFLAVITGGIAAVIAFGAAIEHFEAKAHQLKKEQVFYNPITKRVEMREDPGEQWRPKEGLFNPIADANEKKYARKGGSTGTGVTTSAEAEATNAITGGGRRMITINVNRSFVENFSIHTQQVTQGYDQLKDMVGKAFLEVLNSGASVQ
ncbi:MAG: hypothetical protein EBZ77_15345, partial [Chitinophagia bacterium]|nr:hypothetical protein [Chitinophagia bacterium]